MTVTVNTRCYYTARGYGHVVIFPGFHEDPARRAAVLQEHACEPKKGRVPGERSCSSSALSVCASSLRRWARKKRSLFQEKERAIEANGMVLGHSVLRKGNCLSGFFLFGLGSWES